jgi:hypothetical protein
MTYLVGSTVEMQPREVIETDNGDKVVPCNYTVHAEVLFFETLPKNGIKMYTLKEGHREYRLTEHELDLNVKAAA